MKLIKIFLYEKSIPFFFGILLTFSFHLSNIASLKFIYWKFIAEEEIEHLRSRNLFYIFEVNK